MGKELTLQLFLYVIFLSSEIRLLRLTGELGNKIIEMHMSVVNRYGIQILSFHFNLIIRFLIFDYKYRF